MATPITLDDAIAQILDAVKDRFESLWATELAEFGSLIIGDRARVGFDLPALWVMTDIATNVEPHALQETWEMPLVLVAICQEGDDPEAGYRQTLRMAASARTALLKYDDDRRYRRLNLDFVDDVQSQSFDPARSTPIDNRTLFAAAAVNLIRFRVYERI